MNEKKITVDAVDAFTNYLKRAERSQNTIEKYRRDYTCTYLLAISHPAFIIFLLIPISIANSAQMTSPF